MPETNYHRACRFLMAHYGLPIDEDRARDLEKEFEEAVREAKRF
jgi:hypothetical protein